MRIPLLPPVAASLLIAAFSFTGCVCNHQQQSTCPVGGQTAAATPRVPPGANSRHNAAVQFFNAYKTHNRAAARTVASDAAINALVFDDSAGSNPTLQLVDDTHIYYEGGGITLSLARTAAGRWYVRSVTSRAD